METTKQQPETEKKVPTEVLNNDQLTKQKILGLENEAAIKLSVDIRALFDLYAYRIITPEHFVTSANEVVKEFTEAIKAANAHG